MFQNPKLLKSQIFNEVSDFWTLLYTNVKWRLKTNLSFTPLS